MSLFMKRLRLLYSLVFGLFFAVSSVGCNEPKKTYISMTTSPDRLLTVDVLLNELREYILSDEVSKVYIHIPRLYRNRTAYPADKMRELRELFRRSKNDKEDPGFDGKVEFNEIDFDLGPITKIAPAKAKICNQPENKKARICNPQAKASDDVFVISIDDDYTYRQDYLGHLVDGIKMPENSLVSVIAYKTGSIKNWGIKRGSAGQRFPNVQGSVDMVEGWGSIIYRARDIDDELMRRLSQVSLECRLSDDLVISYVMGINQKMRKGTSPRGRLGALTDVGALSAGSGLESWYHAMAWDAFKQFTLTAPDVGGVVKQFNRVAVLKQPDMVRKRVAESDVIASEEARASGGPFVRVFGHPKVGYIGQDAARELMARVEGLYPDAGVQAAVAAHGAEGNPYKKRFDEFLEHSQMKIDGFKYSRCLRTLNECSYDAAGALKSRERILADCQPEGLPEVHQMPEGEVRIEVRSASGESAVGALIPRSRAVRGEYQLIR